MANFRSHRSVLTCLHGCVASSQPLASQIGVDILKRGGNAADAAVAVAAALNVTEPCSTGLGGDAFCLFYDCKEHTVKAMNASGRSPSGLTLELMRLRGFTQDTGYPKLHGLAVTVPGAAAGWIDCLDKYGSGNLSLKDILAPAIKLATEGFPVAGPFTSFCWAEMSGPLCAEGNCYGKDLLIVEKGSKGEPIHRPPESGEVFENPGLAKVLESIAERGKKGFYEGWVAQAVVDAVKKFGGIMEMDDLLNHKSTFEDPIRIQYKDVVLWECPPSGQGIVALCALNILKNFDLKKLSPTSAEYLHLVMEALKLGFADGVAYCADPSKSDVPISGLLNEEYGRERAKLIKANTVITPPTPGYPMKYQGDTVYFSVVDSDRNACSFINSNYEGFGTGIVPEGCGFSLQNRGSDFSLAAGHLNVVAPEKRPYHTIIPAMVTNATNGDLLASYGVMGGFMQPQGHVQVLLNQVEFGMDPQQALDQPRIKVPTARGPVEYEEGIPEDAIAELREKGHVMEGPIGGLKRLNFGKGQIIAATPFWTKQRKAGPTVGVLWAGSDPRSDGAAAGY